MTLGALTRSVVTVGMVMLLMACSKEESTNTKGEGGEGVIPFTKTLITSYTDTPTSSDRIEVKAYYFPAEEEKWQNFYLNIWSKADENDGLIHPVWGHSFGEKELLNAAKFDSLCKAHDDLSYNQTTRTVVQSCLYRRTTGLHVVSDTDYDAQHPAGTYLDDIVTVRFKSAEDYLKTGYTSLKDYLGKTTGPDYYYEGLPVYNLNLRENLSEFNEIQRKLIQFGFGFKLNKAPDRTDTHRFTITYTNEDGVELTGTTEPVTVRR